MSRRMDFIRTYGRDCALAAASLTAFAGESWVAWRYATDYSVFPLIPVAALVHFVLWTKLSGKAPPYVLTFTPEEDDLFDRTHLYTRKHKMDVRVQDWFVDDAHRSTIAFVYLEDMVQAKMAV